MKKILLILTVCLIGVLSMSLHSCRSIEVVPVPPPNVYVRPVYPYYYYYPRVTIRPAYPNRVTPPPPARHRVR